MTRAKIEIDKENKIIKFVATTRLEDIYKKKECITLFNEMNNPNIKMSTCLAIMANLFSLIEKQDEDSK